MWVDHVQSGRLAADPRPVTWEKGEAGVFERGEREAWREKSVMVALRVRGELALKLEKKNG